MKIEVSIDRTKKLPKGAEQALQTELTKRLSVHFPECLVSVRRAGSDGLSILRVTDAEKERVEAILQETWESADEWFYEQ
ncbi:DinI-like family protein [Yersinia enterocolitica]|uniref:DinI-like family protein n=1 Tax=Yersinia enterocolitica TaxID=630 RepID=UPI000B6324BA|nr:DinI-like family protein [Yersinia enterocolitica]OWF75995.1 DNA damage-inducible protein I [Yersinia kristensenii]EKN4799059.1 DinI-like family protein [Yersinia enterocolitica]EKN4848329.1 DinI-like family protein [Yersinia enterocolitica]EKN5118893.1 DNA damage-inducible protein I [Yersinia enterocolitica]ELI7923499.1 DinI-like family protein [Yersinia enterocolitica]